MRIVLAIAVVAAVAAGAVALARAPGDDSGVELRRYDVRSRFAHRTLPQVAALPPGGGKGRPLLVFLHGRGARRPGVQRQRRLHRALAAQGTRAPVVVFPSGGVSSYWHRRRSGDWARYVLDEVIPAAVKRFGADPDRVAIGGISMGGYGAFEIARRGPGASARSAGTPPRRGRARGRARPARSTTRPTSPATTSSAWRASAAAGRGASARLWLDGGDADPFLSSDHVFARRSGSACASGRAATTALLAAPLPRLPALLRARARALLTCFTAADGPARHRVPPRRRVRGPRPARRGRGRAPRGGVDAHMADPGPLAIEGGGDATSGRFFEDFRNWDRIDGYEEVIRGSRIGEVAAALMGSETVRLHHDHLLVKEPGHDDPHALAPGPALLQRRRVRHRLVLDPARPGAAREHARVRRPLARVGHLVHAALVLRRPRARLRGRHVRGGARRRGRPRRVRHPRLAARARRRGGVQHAHAARRGGLAQPPPRVLRAARRRRRPARGCARTRRARRSRSSTACSATETSSTTRCSRGSGRGLSGAGERQLRLGRGGGAVRGRPLRRPRARAAT